jgi:putative ABC transport system substrate-binding protein
MGRATTVPVVFMYADQPVALGLVASLARPGGNVTGLTTLNAELSGKRLELAREVLPKLRRVGVLSSTAAVTQAALRDAETAARALKIELRPVVAERGEELADAVAAMARQRVEALLLLPSRINRPFRRRIVELALRHHLPVIYGGRAWAADGILIAYGAETDDLCRQSTTLVGRILKGVRPADLPVEQATKFTLFVNLKTAKALGLTIPPSVLARADELIQ